MLRNLCYRSAFFPHLSELGVGFLGPRVVCVGILLTCCIDGIHRLADELLISLEVFLQALDILVAQVGETADVHVVRQVIDLHGNGEGILPYTFDEVIVVLLLRQLCDSPQRIDYLLRKPFGLQGLESPSCILDHIMQDAGNPLILSLSHLHHTQRVTDVIISGLIKLSLMRQGSYFCCSLKC